MRKPSGLFCRELELMRVSNAALLALGVACCSFAQSFTPAYAQVFAPSDPESAEKEAYTIEVGKGANNQAKAQYLKRLSAGGKVYFLTNRHDYSEALAILDKMPRNQTGSALYARAVCLEGLGKHAQAVQTFERAKAKIGLVFKPSYKFYLHYAAALMGAGEYADCMKNLKIAEDAGARSEESADTLMRLHNSIEMRRVVADEKVGNYQQAMQGYLKTLGTRVASFRLGEKLAVDPDRKAAALDWQRQNPSPPPASAPRLTQAKYYYFAGNAFLSLGQLDKAIEMLNKACAFVPEEQYPDVRLRRKFEMFSPLGRVQDSARILLLRIYYSRDDYKACSRTAREMMTRDPIKETADVFTALKMKDVPELVQQRDVDAHSVNAERNVDLSPFIVSTELVSDPFLKNPLLARASKEIQRKDYASCYNTLQAFLDTYTIATSRKPRNTEQMVESYAFRYDYSNVARLLQIPVGIASGRKNIALSLKGDVPQLHSVFWKCVDDILVGRTPQLKGIDEDRITPAVRDDVFHFARAARAMHKSDFSLAAKEFGLVRGQRTVSPYAHVLKQYCEKRK